MNDNNQSGKMTITVDDKVIQDMKHLHGIDVLQEVTNAVQSDVEKEGRRVFYVDVGNLDPEQAQTVMDTVKSNMESAYFYPQGKKKFLSTKTFGNDRGLSCCFRQWRSTHSHCSQVHGYSIGVKFVFECETLDERNWVMDFGGLKGVKQWLEHMFDHTMCVAEDDPLLPMWQQMADNPDTAHAINLRVVPAVGCERFAELVFDYVTKFLDDKRDELLNPTVRLKSVEVFEHGANSAICERD
jgi:6-pyruvoyltetrahydropterin/6-carboxytetrahydropterin synthase